MLKTFHYPKSTSLEVILEDKGHRTWKNINHFLSYGLSGLKGGKNLKQLICELENKQYERKELPENIYFEKDSKLYRVMLSNGSIKIARFTNLESAEKALAITKELLPQGKLIEEIRATIRETIGNLPDGHRKYLAAKRVNKYQTLNEAIIATKNLNICTQLEYRTLFKKDPKLPSNPDTFYKSEWQNWRHFLSHI